MSLQSKPFGMLLLGMSVVTGGVASAALAGRFIHGDVHFDLFPWCSELFFRFGVASDRNHG